VKIEVELGGKARAIELERAGEHLRCTIDGRAVEADAIEVAPGVYSILIEGASLEARVEPGAAGLRVIAGGREYTATIRDPRQWRRHRGAAVEAEGRQQVVAPMPGKIVRVLVNAGEAVEAGQGIVVVEAMKMQNEVRSPKSGTIERMLVTENQAVSAGEVLAVVA
jgi:biotin carboxyl carrier protein